MRRRGSIVIRSEDHLGDQLGLLFMLDDEQLGERVIDTLREYLGERIEVIKAVVTRDRLEVEVECNGFRDESNRLTEAARGLRNNRLYRSALATLADALKLDPLNPHALMTLGEVHQASEQYAEAIAAYIRARETSAGDSAALLAMMGACCLKVERTASAIMYLERAVALDPRQVSARRSLLALGRRPAVAPAKADVEDAPSSAPRKPRAKH